MTARTILTVAFTCTVLFTSCKAPAGGTWPRQGASPGDASAPAQLMPADGLELSISLDRAEYLVGEPVYLSLRLDNTGSEPQRVIGSLDPTDGAIEILVTGPDDTKRAFLPLVEADNDASIYLSLPPGAAIGAVAPIFFGAGGWTFTGAGRYALAAVYRLPDGEGRVMEAISAPLSIEIESSEAGESLVGEGDQASEEVGKFLTWQAGDHLEKGRERLRALLERWPESPLAGYAHSAFARSFGDSFMDYRKNEVRAPDCRRAMDHLTRVEPDRMPGYVRLQNAITGARCELRGKNRKGASAYLGQAKEIAAERPEYRELLRRVAELESYVDEAAR